MNEKIQQIVEFEVNRLLVKSEEDGLEDKDFRSLEILAKINQILQSKVDPTITDVAMTDEDVLKLLSGGK